MSEQWNGLAPTRPEFVVSKEFWPIARDDTGEWIALADSKEVRDRILRDHELARLAEEAREYVQTAADYPDREARDWLANQPTEQAPAERPFLYDEPEICTVEAHADLQSALTRERAAREDWDTRFVAKADYDTALTRAEAAEAEVTRLRAERPYRAWKLAEAEVARLRAVLEELRQMGGLADDDESHAWWERMTNLLGRRHDE